MAVRTIPCRVCGNMFTPCNKTSGALGAFNYREVACSPECGVEYLRRVQAARQKPVEQVPPDATVSTDVTEDSGEIKQAAQRTTRGQRRKAPIIEDAAIVDE